MPAASCISELESFSSEHTTYANHFNDLLIRSLIENYEDATNICFYVKKSQDCSAVDNSIP